MASRLWEFVVLTAILIVVSLGLYLGCAPLRAAAPARDTAPFHCTLPPGVSAVEAGCHP
jgi:hypothetical protein